jgi:hypothetical protein
MTVIGFNLFPVQAGRVAENNLIDKLFDGRPVQFLVRECAQNSVDAAVLQRGGSTARVHFRLTNLDRGALEEFGLATAETHAKACQEFSIGVPDPGGKIRALLVEDESGGLPGQVTSHRNDWESPLGRYLFSVGTGVSGKNGKSNGRHGLGSGTGAAASKIRCMYVYSRRLDNTSIASARLSLPTHVIDGEQYADEARLGILSDEGRWMGILEGEQADRLAHALDFNVGMNSYGLSTAIIAPDDTVTYDSLVATVLREQFYQVGKGMIEFLISDEDSGRSIVINKSTLGDVIDQVTADSLDGRGRKARDSFAWLREVISLIRAEPLKLSAMELDSRSVPPEMRASWLSGKIVGCGVPVSAVHAQNGSACGTIKIWMKKLDDMSPGVVVNVRDAIVNIKEVTGYVAITVSQGDDAAILLGDAENPPHTQYRIGNAKNRGWLDPRPVMDVFLKGAATLQRLLVAADDTSDRISLARFFPMPGSLLPGSHGAGAASEEGHLAEPIATGIGASDILRFDIDYENGLIVGVMSTDGKKAYHSGENFDLTVVFEFLKSGRRGDGTFADTGAIVSVEAGAENGHSFSGNTLSLFGATPDLRIVVRNVDLNRDLTVACSRYVETDEA